MKHEYISFLTNTSKKKPDTMRNPSQTCPFCNTETLLKENNVVHQDGNKLLIKNKFPVLKNTDPLVLVENNTCDLDITTYPKNMLIDVLRYGLTTWLKMKNSGEYKSVLFFKNHGPYSAGSIHHPHMQIIGLRDKNPEQNLDFSTIDGVVIRENEHVKWSLSTHPFTENHEFTIRMKGTSSLDFFAMALQSTTHYILNHLNTKYKSYNLCFYHVNDEIIVKILDRRPTSALLLGYSLSQVPDNLEHIAEKLRSLYPFN